MNTCPAGPIVTLELEPDLNTEIRGIGKVLESYIPYCAQLEH